MGLLVFSASALAAISFAKVSSAAEAHYPANPMSVRDDRCYSTLSEVSKVTGLLGQGNFGMVNAIVNAPIYDWDQGNHVNARSTAYRSYNLLGKGFGNGLRGPLKGVSVGYAQNFDFTVQPVPNLIWLAKYIGLQLPNDAGKLAWLAGGPNPVRTVDGSRANPYIANPFIYMQSALIMPNGLPQFQAVTGPLADLSSAAQGKTSISDIFRIDTFSQMANFQNYQLQENSGLIGALNGGAITVNDISRIASELNSGSSAAEASIETLIGDIAGLPGISHYSAYSYNVTGSKPEDNCYEDISPSVTNQVPSYAFSVPGFAIPVTMPGWLFSVVTLLDGKGPSSSGMTMYLGGSINGKAMLDCYGRGVTPMVTGHDTYKVRDFNPLGAIFLTPVFGIASAGINAAIWGAVQAAAAAADGAAPGTGSAVREVGMSIPAVTSKYETYTSGFAFLFSLKRKSIDLPTDLQNRVVDYNYLSGSQSKVSDINVKYAIGGIGHDESQNGQQFNPDIYLKLKQPYVLEPKINIGSTPRKTLDGTTVSVSIDNAKHGFNKGNTLIPTAGDKYREDTSSKGGPTYNDNDASVDKNAGKPFTQARVYKIVMQPGVIPNAIDNAKINATGTKGYYNSTTSPAVNGATDPCSFFAQQLKVGDTAAKPSSLTTNGSNANNSAQSPQTIDNRPLGQQNAAFTCGVVHSEDVRMTSNDSTKSMYQIDEKIPAETAPGTKYCYAVYYTNYTNDLKTRGKDWWDGSQVNYNADYSTPADKTYLSRAHCIVSGYKPSLQVRDGDLMIGGDARTGVNDKEFLASNPRETRRYGSWVEYGIIAAGSVNNMGSGAIYRTGMKPGLDDLGYITFSNNKNTSTNTKQYGNYAETIDDGFAQVTRQFASMSGQVPAADPVRQAADLDLNSSLIGAEGGVYVLRNGPVNVTVGSPDNTLAPKKSIILLAQPNTVVNIASNIKTPTRYGSVADMSQVVIAPISETTAYRINLNAGVSQVDAWLINANGTINTCNTGSTDDLVNTPRAKGLCDNTVTVNGPVSAKTLLLRRNGGKDQGDETTLQQSIPGENFNLRPDAYIWAANYVNNGSKKYVTTNSLDLPPRY